MIVWKADYSKSEPTPVECEVFGYPNKDANGDTMFANSHYATKEEAWEHIINNLQAGMKMRARDRRDSQERLQRITTELADISQRFVEAKESLAEFKRTAGEEVDRG